MKCSQTRACSSFASFVAAKLDASLSSECTSHVMAAYCSFMIPTCHVDAGGDAVPEILCREECERVKDEFCDLDAILHGSGEFGDLNVSRGRVGNLFKCFKTI